MVLKILLVLLPWCLRRPLLQWMFSYRLHPTSFIALAWVFPNELVMEAGTTIGNLTVCKNLGLIHMKSCSQIGRGNWITGFPLGHEVYFAHEKDRKPELILGEHSAITNRHLIDCTNSVTIGQFTTFAGFQSQILTHSIDLRENRQSSAPIRIGDYCFIGTNCVLLGGSSLPDYSVLGAKSLLNKSYTEARGLYAGTPARLVKRLPLDLKYFQRKKGHVA